MIRGSPIDFYVDADLMQVHDKLWVQQHPGSSQEQIQDVSRANRRHFFILCWGFANIGRDEHHTAFQRQIGLFEAEGLPAWSTRTAFEHFIVVLALFGYLA